MPEHPILENTPLTVYVDDTEVPLIQFVYDIILNQNLELFTLLRRIPERDMINSFELTIWLKRDSDNRVITVISESSMDPICESSLFINENRVGLKQFVQNIIFGINYGILQTLDGCNSTIQQIKLKYQKQ